MHSYDLVHETVGIRALADPSLMSERAKRDAELRPEIRRMWQENFEVYGVRQMPNDRFMARGRWRRWDRLGPSEESR